MIHCALERTPCMANPIVVPCPRCAGRGRADWHPDQGICYLCSGKAHLAVDIPRGERHLAYLRGQYRLARQAGDECRMEYLAKKGQNKRDLVELAKQVASKADQVEAKMKAYQVEHQGY